MSEEFKEVVNNIRESSAWVRVLFVLAFALALNFIILPIVIVLSIAQALFSILSADSNANLRYFAATLNLYISQIVKYLTYTSEEKPFPFSNFPEADGESAEEDDSTEKGKTQNTGKSRTGTGNTNNGAKNANDVSDVSSKNAATESSTAAKKKSPTKKTANKEKTAKKPDADKEASRKSSGSDIAESQEPL